MGGNGFIAIAVYNFSHFIIHNSDCMSVLFFMLKQFVKLGRGREGLDLLGFSPNLYPKLLNIILVVDRCPRFSGDASRISNAFTYLFILLILIHLRFKVLFNAQEHPVVIIKLSLRVPLYITASVDLQDWQDLESG